MYPGVVRRLLGAYCALFALAAAAYGLPLRCEAHGSGFLCRTSGASIVIQPNAIWLGPSALRLSGANRGAKVEGVGSPARTNYIGRRIGIPTYTRIRVRGVYPGIDVEYYGTGGELEFDWIVAPGAEPRRVQFELNGPATVDSHGDLHVGAAIYRRPVARQGAETVPARYVLKGRRVSFALGHYDRRRELVIDPVLSYAGFPGGDSFEVATADRDGNLYVAGTSATPDLDGAFRLTQPARFINLSPDDGATWTPTADAPPGCESTLAVNPLDPAVFLAAGPSAICKSTDGGRTWRTVSQAGGIASIAWDPKDPRCVYGAFTFNGVLKSGDGGETWSAANTGIGPDGFFRGQHILVDPAVAARVYLNTQSGIYVSEDRAATWTMSLKDAYGALALDPAQTGTVYAVGSDYAVYRSTNAGRTWERRSSGVLIGAMTVANDAVVYGLTPFGVVKSPDGAATWETTGLNIPGLSSVVARGDAVLAAASASGIYRSTDGGSTWSQVLDFRNRLLRALLFGANGTAVAAFSVTKDVFVAKYAPGGETLLFATYFGGRNDEMVNAIATDHSGNVAIAGGTYSPDFPTPFGPGPDAYSPFVSVLNPRGDGFVFSTLVKDLFYAAAFDASGNLFLVGAAKAGPINYNYVPSVAKLAADGSRFLFERTLGGGGSYRDFAYAVAVNGAGDAIVAGQTQAQDFPVTETALQKSLKGAQDGFLTKISGSDGSIQYSTYLGGGGDDGAAAVAVDDAGNIYVTGATGSTDFPITDGVYQTVRRSIACPAPAIPFIGIGTSPPADVFVTKLSPDATSIIYSTYFGGGCASSVSSIAVDHAGNAFLGGSTLRASPAPPPEFLLFAPFEYDPACGTSFIAGLNATGSALLFSSWLDIAGLARVATDGTSWLYAVGQGCSASIVSPNGKPLQAGRTGYLVRLDLPDATAPSIDRVVDAFTGLPGPVTPGELLMIQGSGIRTDAPADRGMNPPTPLATVLGGVRVWFDNVPAPVMSVYPGTVYVMAPTPVAQRTSVRIVAESDGVRSNAFVALAAAVNPSPFDTARNEDGSVNSASNPARRGSVLTLYATGLGSTDPPLVDGGLGAYPLARPLAAVSVSCGDTAGEVLNVSAMPGFIVGIFQIQVRIPESAPANDRTSTRVSAAGVAAAGPSVALR